MAQAKKPEPAKSNASIRPGGAGPAAESLDRSRANNTPRQAGVTLPVEPVPPWEAGQSETTRGAAAHDPARVLRELQDFYLHGPYEGSEAEHASPQWPTPALIAPFRDLNRIRYDYPLCVLEGNAKPAIRTLTAIVDEVIAAAADSSDEGQRLKRRIYQLESAVKRLADREPGAKLSALWNRAADEMIATTRLVDDDKQMLKQDMNVARGARRMDGELIPCGPHAARRIFRAAISSSWNERAALLAEEIDSLSQELRQILAVSFTHTSEAKSPEQLEAAVGDEESMDFQAMSSILRQSHVGEPIPETRLKRIRDTLSVLERFKPLFLGEAVFPSGRSGKAIGIDVFEKTCSTVRERFDRERRLMSDFFKAARIGRLEVENRYHEETHDSFFARFGPAQLTSGELESCPPIPVVIEGDDLARQEKNGLLDVLSGGIPVKALVEVHDLLDETSLTGAQAVRVGWPARLAGAACGLHDVYVLQAPASDAALIQEAMQGGLRYRGPAVFVVYAGDSDHQPGLPAYHSAAAAVESRVFPALKYDPGEGSGLADRMDISRNPSSEEAYSAGTFAFVGSDGEEKKSELAFTAADFLFCDIRASRHFWRVPPGKWHRDMLPLHAYLGLDEKATENKVPYLTAVSPAGDVMRIVPTRTVVVFVRKCGDNWRIVQEYGGINSSFALAALAGEKGRLEKDKEREVEAIRREYEEARSRNLGDVTREIIRRIVDGIVSGTAPTAATPGPAAASTESASSSAAPAPTADAKGAPAPAPAEAAEEEDEAVSLDEPYIDTPLCTSCNECTNLNNALFAYNENKQAFVKDPAAGTFRELVAAAEKCPVHIIHPGKPKNPDEPGLDELVERAARFN